ncbi:unnamed protein product [Urochloa humidicola]
MMPVAAAAEDWSECAFSLTCEEDGADLGDGSVDDGVLFSPYNAGDEEEEEEYLEQLVFKETTSFCSSSSESDSAADCDGDADGEEYQPVASEEWFRRARLAAVKWILETRGLFGFGHRTAYLAIAYFDSFLLRRRVDKEAMPWAARLLSVACVSVAAKMEERQAPALSEFDAGDYDSCPASIRRMELLVLSTLGWRMAAVTPFDFLPCFTSRLHPHGGAGAGGRAAVKAIGFIFATAQAGSVLDHRPSTVAAAAILAATYGPAVLTKEALDSKMSYLSPSCLIDKEHVHACYSMMVGDMNRRGSKRSCSGSDEVATSTYDSVLVDDDVTAFATAVAARNKRIRLELTGIR